MVVSVVASSQFAPFWDAKGWLLQTEVAKLGLLSNAVSGLTACCVTVLTAFNTNRD